jgi:MoaA/NifB/PqqE/SkfB family radical SAM enzyme
VDDRQRVKPRELFRERPGVVLVNASCLLDNSASIASLVEAARGGLALGLSDDNRSLTAVAIDRSAVDHPDCTLALSRLVAHGQEESLAGPAGRCSAFSPNYINTALAELLFSPAVTGPVDQSPERMRQAFLAQRDCSAVPWIFNTLVNEIEYRMGRPVLDSFPPEFHLSITGRCNIECRFCSYTHETAYSHFVDVNQVARLDFFRHVHTLRLSSGLGEPTLNPHLPGIIKYISTSFPHIGMNFFTNGTILRRRGLIDAMVNRMAWVNVSLNAVTPETWQELCEKNMFDCLVGGLKDLQEAKRSQGTAEPIVYGSMVLTRSNLPELPRMPAFCRSVGIDRFTGIPFLSYAYDWSEKYGPAESFHRCRDLYEPLYWQTVAEARRHKVSLEIPMPQDCKRSAFGVEVRSFYDFAEVEKNLHRLGLLVETLAYDAPGVQNCREIWKIAYAGSRDRNHAAAAETHFLYPCLGPLGIVDFSTRTGFDFPNSEKFLELWNSPVLVKLRTAQRWAGLSRICDACRTMDSRDPNNFAVMKTLLADWQARPQPAFIPVEELTLRRA